MENEKQTQSSETMNPNITIESPAVTPEKPAASAVAGNVSQSVPVGVSTAATVSAPTGVNPTVVGMNGPFPAELNHWNWGAFFLSWIWAIGNQTWIGLLALIPFFGIATLVMGIILGIKGNEWAWENRKFESVEQFKKVQHIWSIWGVVLFIIPIVGILLTVALVAFRASSGS